MQGQSFNVIYPNGNIDVFNRIKPFTLGELYDIIECELVEIVRLRDGTILIIDEEGKIRNKDLNLEATLIAGSQIMEGDYLCGTVIHCSERLFQ